VTRYPTLEETVAVHARLIAQFGGSLGVRDRAALESALAQARSGYYSDVIQEAAPLSGSAFAESCVRGWNKRVAVTMTAAFLQVNGYRLQFNDSSAFSFLLGLYQTGRMRFEELEGGFDSISWLPTHPRRGALPPPVS